MENIDVSSEYSSSVPVSDGSAGEQSFNSIIAKVEAIANEGVSSEEPESEAPAEQESEAENAEQVEAAVHGDDSGESAEAEGDDEPADASADSEEASPLASIKAQIEAGEIKAEDISRELGLSVTSKQITQLAQEMSKAKELQREAKKGAETVAKAREILEKAKRAPVELLQELAGPNFVDNYLMQQAGIEQPEKQEEPAPDFNQIIAQREEQRRQTEIAALVQPWQQGVDNYASNAKSVAPNALRYLGSEQALAQEAQTLVDQIAINREQELGRPLTPIEAHLILQDWTAEKAIATLEAEAAKIFGASEASGAAPGSLHLEPAKTPQQPKKKPQTLTGEMAEQSADTLPDLDKYTNDRDRLIAFMQSKKLKP